MMATKYALSEKELDAEVKALKICWQAMTGLNTEARERLIGWLHNWTRSESHD